MKIVGIRTKKPEVKRDMFAVLCLIQCAALVSMVLLIFIVSRTDGELFLEMKQDIGKLFAEDLDIGGYYTENNEPSVQGAVINMSQITQESVAAEKETQAQLVADAPGDNVLEVYDSAYVMPVNGTVTSEYGSRIHPVYYTESFHSGRDIAAAEGSNIYAVADGTVIAAGQAEKAGLYVKIDHGNGYTALYCHCSALYTEEGINVRKGEVIAAVGQTGLATGPHLHFELYRDGVITDPGEILAGAVNVD